MKNQNFPMKAIKPRMRAVQHKCLPHIACMTPTPLLQQNLTKSASTGGKPCRVTGDTDIGGYSLYRQKTSVFRHYAGLTLKLPNDYESSESTCKYYSQILVCIFM